MTGGGSSSSDPGDSVILATAGYDHTVRFWQAHSGICSRTVQHPDSQVNALHITPEKHLIAAAGYQHIRMYDLHSNNPNPLISYDGISKNVTAVGFQENGKWMYTGGEDNSAKIWDLRSRNLQCQSIFQTNAPVTTVCLHPNQVELFVGDQSGAIHVWDLKANKCNVQLMPETDASVLSLNIDPDGSYMAAVNNKGNCYVWTLSSGRDNVNTQARPRSKFSAHERQVLKCQFSPDSTLLATTSADTTARLWKSADFSLVSELKERTQRWVWDCAFSADSEYLITASSDAVARLWSVETADIKREYNGHQKAIVCLAFSDDPH